MQQESFQHYILLTSFYNIPKNPRLRRIFFQHFNNFWELISYLIILIKWIHTPAHIYIHVNVWFNIKKNFFPLLITKHVRTWLDFLLLWTSKNVINLKRTNRLQSILAPIPHTVASVAMAPPNCEFLLSFRYSDSMFAKCSSDAWSSLENLYSKNMVERQYINEQSFEREEFFFVVLPYRESRMGTPTNWFAISRNVVRWYLGLNGVEEELFNRSRSQRVIHWDELCFGMNCFIEWIKYR